MKKIIIIFFVSLSCITFSNCKKDEKEISPSVPYKIEINGTDFCNGDNLYGRVIIDEKSLIPGTEIKKIDCRLGNIVIGTVENEMICPFGVILKDKPIGKHTFSIIIKCESPGYDETFWRYDLEIINITE